MSDLVSIIMPSYNTAAYIADSIASVLAQTYINWELIIVDDCSSDETDIVVLPFLKDNRVHYLKNERNSGAAVSRNRALSEAKGRYIAFLDSDDLWLPDKLAHQIAFMQENQSVFSYTAYEEMDAEGIPLGMIVRGPKRITKRGMYRYCWPGCLTVMYDAQAVGFIQIKPIRKNNDYAMWLQICRKSDCRFLDETLARYRRGRNGSVSTQSIRTLLVWHYRLFREADGKSVFTSVLYTMRNMIFGAYKKLRYVHREK